MTPTISTKGGKISLGFEPSETKKPNVCRMCINMIKRNPLCPYRKCIYGLY